MAKDDHWRRRAELAEALVTEQRLALDLARTSPACAVNEEAPAGERRKITVANPTSAGHDWVKQRFAAPAGPVVGHWILDEAPALVEAERARKQATGQQKRADRLRRDLAALHATHAREKRGRRKVEQRLTARTRERDELSRRVVKAERACEDLRRERDNLVESRDDRDSTIRRLELKLAAVRVLRRAMRNAIAALGSIPDGEHASTISGARGHLRAALDAVIDPDDGRPH